MRPPLVLTLLATIALLGACGHRGPLTLPPQPTAPIRPAAAQPSPAPAPEATTTAPSAKDSNTAGDASR
nr:lipoprotein [Candidatus Accumulibacter aalborgensis]